MKKIPLHWKIIIGLLLGVVWALFSSYLGLSQFTLDWINPFGEIFINLLKLIAVPLVLFSIIKSIYDLSDIKKLGKIGVTTMFLYVVTTLFSVSLGVILTNVIKPANAIAEETKIVSRMSYEIWAKNTKNVEIVDGKNFLNDPQYSKYIDKAEDLAESDIDDKVKNVKSMEKQSPLQMLVDVVPNNIFNALSAQGMMLQVVFFAILFGTVVLTLDNEKAEPVMKLIDGFNEVFLKMVQIIMNGAPFFVFCLLAGKISEMAGNNPQQVIEIFKGLSSYSGVVLLGLGIVLFIFYPLLILLLTKGISYMGFFRAVGEAQTVAFSTSSSAATLPVTMKCVNENLKVPEEISNFVLPIGATVNMNGTSLYIAIAVIFLAQFHLVDLSVSQQITIIITSTLAAIGASAVPSAALIMMIMVLQSVGLNPAWIAIIIPVDRILDMCRTVVNVTGDTAVAAIIAHRK